MTNDQWILIVRFMHCVMYVLLRIAPSHYLQEWPGEFEYELDLLEKKLMGRE